MKTIVLGTAHAEDTPGKRSPDGKFREYKFSREITSEVSENLKKLGVDVLYIDAKSEPNVGYIKKNKIIPTNNYTKGKDALYFVLHCNASAKNGWDTARGISIYTTKGKTKSDEYAEIIYDAIENEFNDITPKDRARWKFWRGDKTDGDIDYEANFNEIMCRPPAVLLEFLFQNNKKDVALLNDESIKERLIETLTSVLFEIAKK